MADKPWTPPEEIILTEQDDVFLTLHVVYHDPKDYPGMWVVRRQYVTKAMHPDDHPKVDREPLIVCRSLEEARAALPWGVVNINRMEGDDRKIYEVWV